MPPKKSKTTDAKPWDKEALTALINAYKEERSLYVVSSANYHNKHLRAEAILRVSTAVCLVRPESTEKECMAKMHNIRTQYNVENTKVKASIKSGTGTDDIYKPNLWYFDSLKFLEEYVIRRKNKTSKLPTSRNIINVTQRDDANDQSTYGSQTIVDHGLSEDGTLNVFIEDEDSESFDLDDTQFSRDSDAVAGPSSSGGSTLTSNIIASTSQISPETLIPSPSLSSRNSSSGSQSARSPLAHSRNAKRRKSQNDDPYVGAIESIAKSLREPITIPASHPTPHSTDTVDTCLAFVGSILKGFSSNELKLEVMGTVVQTVLNAKNVDLERANRK